MTRFLRFAGVIAVLAFTMNSTGADRKPPQKPFVREVITWNKCEPCKRLMAELKRRGAVLAITTTTTQPAITTGYPTVFYKGSVVDNGELLYSGGATVDRVIEVTEWITP